MNEEMYRAGGNDRLNLPIGSAAYRKKLMLDMLAFDASNNIPISQHARHTIPNWVLILACLPPNDTDEIRTIDEIQSIITDLEYPIRHRSILNALMPMTSRNPAKREEMSKIVRETLVLVGGIVTSKVTEDGVNMGSYTLGISTRNLEELVKKNQFVTYSFNLNDNLAVRLLGGI